MDTTWHRYHLFRNINRFLPFIIFAVITMDIYCHSYYTSLLSIYYAFIISFVFIIFGLACLLGLILNMSNRMPHAMLGCSSRLFGSMCLEHHSAILVPLLLCYQDRAELRKSLFMVANHLFGLREYLLLSWKVIDLMVGYSTYHTE